MSNETKVLEIIESLIDKKITSQETIKKNINHPYYAVGYYEGMGVNNLPFGKGIIYTDDTKKTIIAQGTFDETGIVQGVWYTSNTLDICSLNWFVGTFVDRKLQGEGLVYYDYDKKYLKTKGIYDKGVFIQGESHCDGRVSVGTFDSDRSLTGEGCVYSKFAEKILHTKGSYKGGRLVTGEWLFQGKLYVGTFVNQRLEGEGCVYSGWDKKVLHSKGVYNREILIDGEIYHKGKVYVGKFNGSKLHGEGCIYSDLEKTKLESKGVYNQGDLVNGESFCNGKWYIGMFVDGKLHGDGYIFSDLERTKLESKGVYEKGIFVKGGTLNTAGNWQDGTFVDGILHGEGYVYSDCEKTNLKSTGVYENGLFVEGETTTNFGHWYVGRVDNQSRYEGKGVIYTDSTKTVLIARGTYSNGVLIQGECIRHCLNDKYSPETKNLYENAGLVGTFGYTKDSNCKPLNGYFETYKDSTKTVLLSKGYYVNSLIVRGENFVYSSLEKKEETGRWYCGVFKNGKLTEGTIFSDYKKEIIHSTGKYVDDLLVEGQLYKASQDGRNSAFYSGIFVDEKIHGIGYLYTLHQIHGYVCDKYVFVNGIPTCVIKE